MRRPLMTTSLVAISTLLTLASGPVAAAAPTPSARPIGVVAPRPAAPAVVVTRNGDVRVEMPASMSPRQSFAVSLKLPAGVAAVDGRVVVRRDAAEVVGYAPVGRGTALRPVETPDGYAFGAYGLSAAGGATTLQIIIYPHVAGRLQLRVVIDSAASASGASIALQGRDTTATAQVGGGRSLFAAPVPRRAPARLHAPRGVRETLRDGRFDQRDLDLARAAWAAARVSGRPCAGAADGDANGDGCVDAADLEGLTASLGRTTTATLPTLNGTGASLVSTSAVTTTPRTMTVNSTADREDAAKGDGICADSTGTCTLRAALQEADYVAGDDRIVFNLPGTAPVRIQLAPCPTGVTASYCGGFPLITSRVGTVTIDGYSQPGSRVNNATVGSNAIPGVEIRGNGNSVHEMALYLTSFQNTVRGLAFTNLWRGMFVDGANAYENRIVGNWIGFNGDGTNSAGGQYGIVLNQGASRNVVGTPDLADRNLIGNVGDGINEYGSNVNGNVIQDNVFCMGPTGFTKATCNIGIDHNFGPHDGLIGGDGPNERNVVGPTIYQAIEYSHGWNPAYAPRVDSSAPYNVSGHTAVGNWLGFRGDGSYDAGFRSGLTLSSADNDQGINVIDGAVNNTVRNNIIGSAYDGIQLMGPTTTGNLITDNLIGVSPLGEPAPMAGYGVKLRWETTYDTIQANTIRNAAAGGVGLTENTVYNIKITRNITSDTSGPGILLTPDPANPTTGANTLLAPPAITAATLTAVSGTASAGSTVEVFRASRAAGASGLPSSYVGAAVASSSGAWTVPVTLAVGDTVSATQIRPDWNTSTFAVNVTAADTRAATTTTLAVSPSSDPTVFTFQATVSPAPADGSSITFFLDGTQLGTPVATSGGVATLSNQVLAPGDHTVFARFGGDTTLFGSDSPPAQVSSRSATTTSIAVSPVAPAEFDPVTLTVSVLLGDGTAPSDGVLQLVDQTTGATLGSTTLSSTTSQLIVTTSSLAAGTHQLLATYAGSATAAASSATQSLTVTSTTRAVTNTSLAASATTIKAGDTVRLDVAVSPTAATGSVDILDGTTLVQTLPLGADGTASFQWTPAAGTHTIHAQYSGDSRYVPSTSPDIAIAVDGTAPAASISIAGGAAYTSRTAVTLSISATDPGSPSTGVTQMRLANDGGAFGAWTPFATSVAWTLTSGDAVKTVTVEIRDAVGNSSTTSDTIRLDTTAPSLSGVTTSLATALQFPNTTGYVRLAWTASDSGSGLARFEVATSTDGVAYGTSSTVAATARATNVGIPVNSTRWIRIRAVDNAGFVSAWVVAPSVGVDLVDSVSTRLTYSSNWSTQSLSSASGGSVNYSSSSSARADMTFTGRSIALVTTLATSRGYVDVYIDGTRVASVNTYSGTTTYRWVVYTAPNKASGSHTVRISPHGSRDSRSSSSRIDLDAILILR